MAGRVLVVDDEERILITMRAVLEQDGYAASTSWRSSASTLRRPCPSCSPDMPRSTRLSVRCAGERTTT